MLSLESRSVQRGLKSFGHEETPASSLLPWKPAFERCFQLSGPFLDTRPSPWFIFARFADGVFCRSQLEIPPMQRSVRKRSWRGQRQIRTEGTLITQGQGHEEEAWQVADQTPHLLMGSPWISPFTSTPKNQNLFMYYTLLTLILRSHLDQFSFFFLWKTIFRAS